MLLLAVGVEGAVGEEVEERVVEVGPGRRPLAVEAAEGLAVTAEGCFPPPTQ